MTLDTITGDLRTYNQLEPFSLLHADELTAEQVDNPSLRTRSFYVADFPLYTLEGEQKTPTLWLARHTAQEPNNLVLRHLDDDVNSSFEQLVKTGNYHPTLEEAQEVMDAQSTLRIDLTKLKLKGNDKQWRYLEINTTNYDSLNAEERLLAERFYGQGNNFVAAMKLLKDTQIDNTKVYVLCPEYITQEAAESPLGRAAWRSYFRYDSASSYAVSRGIGSRDALRGVRREKVIPEGNAPQIEVPPTPQEITFASCYNHLLADEMSATAALNDISAAGLSRILAGYLTTKTQ